MYSSKTTYIIISLILTCHRQGVMVRSASASQNRAAFLAPCRRTPHPLSLTYPKDRFQVPPLDPSMLRSSCPRISRSLASPIASSSSSLPPNFPSSSRRHASAWAAVKQSLPSLPFSSPSSPSSTATSELKGLSDPLKLVKSELSLLRSNVSHLLGSGHPSLDTVAKYYFQAEGKHIRPTIVLLMSQATNGLGTRWAEMESKGGQGLDRALTKRGDVLNDLNPSMPESTRSFQKVFIPSPSNPEHSSSPNTPNSTSPLASSFTPRQSQLITPPTLLPTQRRLAEISEMIHVASLLHDDVIDSSPTRRGSPSSPALFGNKLSILAGDFLLGRASASLARLGSTETVELLSTVIANLVEGEVMQLKATTEPERRPTAGGFDRYMQKTYLKTASLMAKSARAAVILGGSEDEGLKDVAYAYGRNLGIAFQVSSLSRLCISPF
jgi:hexaprenyl-diphosphate synthase